MTLKPKYLELIKRLINGVLKKEVVIVLTLLSAVGGKRIFRLKKINFGLISLLPKSAQQIAKTGKIGF